MNVKPRSTQRSLRAHQDAVDRADAVTQARHDAGFARQGALSLILGHGCATCWGRQDVRSAADGKPELHCPILTEAAAGAAIGPEIVTAAKGCKVPRLWERVVAGEKEAGDVTAEAVAKLVPHLVEDEELKETDPAAALGAGETSAPVHVDAPARAAQEG